MEKHQAGYLAKKAGASQKEISRIFKVSENTVGNWSKKYGWEDKIAEDQLFQETSLEQVRSLITFNLKVLNAIKDKKSEKADLATSDVSELQKMLTDKGEVDALNKLFVNVRGKEITWEQVVKTMREFLEYLEDEDIKLAQGLTEHVEYFLDLKRKSS